MVEWAVVVGLCQAASLHTTGFTLNLTVGLLARVLYIFVSVGATCSNTATQRCVATCPQLADPREDLGGPAAVAASPQLADPRVDPGRPAA